LADPGLGEGSPRSRERGPPTHAATPRRAAAGYAGALASAALTTALAWPLAPVLDSANLAMLYLLAVLAVALRWGRGPSVLASIAGVVAFDFFFVPPAFSLAVSDAQYLVTFAVMLAVGLITGYLTAGIRQQAAIARAGEERARALYELARELSAAVHVEQVARIVETMLAQALRADCALLLPDGRGQLAPAARETQDARPGGSGAREAPDPSAGNRGASATPSPPALVPDPAQARQAFAQAPAADAGPVAPTLATPDGLAYLPLHGPMRTRGVLVLRPRDPPWLMRPEPQRQLQTSARLIAISLERLHYVAVAHEAMVRARSEHLRNTLLSAVSHDLRTPLTALVGWAELLALPPGDMPPAKRALAQAIADEARRTARLVDNLLQMARIRSGPVEPRLQWQSIEETIGSALRSAAPALTGLRTQVALPDDVPLVRYDALMIERVIVNLVENAARHGRRPPSAAPIATGLPADGRPDEPAILIAVEVGAHDLRIDVCDRGPGLPASIAASDGARAGPFDWAPNGDHAGDAAGHGLGLSICKALVDAHGGQIDARARDGGGACFRVTLPRDPPPWMDDAEALG
jgi:two-component system sensor histidine kinase KdpD